MYDIKPIITRQDILNSIPEESIVEFYTKVPFRPGVKFKSPFRNDENPSCACYYTRQGRIRIIDFGGKFRGDIFAMVQELYNCDFKASVQVISKDFGISSLDIDTPNRVKKPVHIKSPSVKETSIEIGIRNWNEIDKDFWTQFGITKKTLQAFGTFPCNVIKLNGDVVYSFNRYDPAYAYRLGYGKYKIYFPFRKKDRARFLSNCNIIQGSIKMPSSGEYIIVTKSMKDVMALYEFGIPAIAPMSESTYLTKDEVSSLKKSFKTIYTFYDFDYTGISTAAMAKREYGIIPIFLTNGRFGTYDYKAKDFSDFVKLHGKEKVELLITILKQLHEKQRVINNRDSSIYKIRKIV